MIFVNYGFPRPNTKILVRPHCLGDVVMLLIVCKKAEITLERVILGVWVEHRISGVVHEDSQVRLIGNY